MKKLLFCVLALSGCISWQKIAASQASQDHRCPPEKVRVVSYSDDGRNIELDVCGRARQYRDINPSVSEGMSTWLDVTKQLKD